MRCLVGKTGFVGSNLWASGAFDCGYHSKDIEQAYGLQPDLLVYAGVRAEKYLANCDAALDWQQVSTALDNIRAIAPQKLVLISTVDVYPDPQNVDEDAVIDIDVLQPYGRNRRRLEEDVQQLYPQALIVRLPALYGKNLKKNFIYDMMTLIPYMLHESKFQDLAERSALIRQSYTRQSNGFYVCTVNEQKRADLKELFQQLGFTALNFTDSRSVYQFYPLKFLWQHVEMALKENITILNLATEPVQAGELYHFLYGDTFTNEVSSCPAQYDYRTKYTALYHGKDGYIFDKKTIMEDIRTFVEADE